MFSPAIKFDEAQRSVNKEKYCCICKSGLEDAFPLAFAILLSLAGMMPR